MHGQYSVFLGLDVGKGEHHAVALNRDGDRLHDAPLPKNHRTTPGLMDTSRPNRPPINALSRMIQDIDLDELARDNDDLGLLLRRLGLLGDNGE